MGPAHLQCLNEMKGFYRAALGPPAAIINAQTVKWRAAKLDRGRNEGPFRFRHSACRSDGGRRTANGGQRTWLSRLLKCGVHACRAVSCGH